MCKMLRKDSVKKNVYVKMQEVTEIRLSDATQTAREESK